MKRTLLFALSLSLFVSNGFAKSVSIKDYNWIKKDDMKSLIKKAQARKFKRKIANIDDESEMSPLLKKYRDRMVEAKVPADIDAILSDYQSTEKFDQFPYDLKFYAAMLAPYQTMRGLVYRLAPVAEKQRITHSALLTSVLNLVSNVRVFTPQKNAEALMEYLVQPYKTANGKVVSQFKTFAEFQDYLTNVVYQSVLEASVRLKTLGEINGRVVWDNKIGTGPDSYKDNWKRYRYFYEVDRNMSLLSLNLGMSYLKSLSSYDVENVLDLVKEQGKLYGVDGFLWGQEDGVSAYDRTKLLYSKFGFKNCKADARFKKEYKKLFTLRKNGKDDMHIAFLHLNESVRLLRIVWEDLRGRSEDEKAIINPSKVLPWEKDVDRNLDILESAMEGPIMARSRVTGETATVDIPTMYSNPPADMKVFLPYCFNLDSKTMKTAEGIKYRNFHYGEAKKWRVNKFKMYYPDLKTDDDVFRAARVFNQLGGKWVQLMPFGGNEN